MTRSLFHSRSALSIVAHLALASGLVLGCGGDGNGTVDAGRDAGGGDAAVNNPPNPDGLGPARLVLGSPGTATAAASYVLLAKTGVTNVTGTLITGGDVGVSPEVAASITGFGETLDISGTFATSPSLASPARLYASNHTEPTPTNLTAAVLGMEAAYSDGATRTGPDFLNLSDGNLGGLTLAPGLYHWGSTVTVPQNVTISGAATDVWIFQITNELDVSSDVQIILAGNAQASNIFWVVADEVTIHAGAHFEGILLAQTGVTLQTGASMNGRIYAQSLIALDDNAITAP